MGDGIARAAPAGQVGRAGPPPRRRRGWRRWWRRAVGRLRLLLVIAGVASIVTGLLGDATPAVAPVSSDVPQDGLGDPANDPALPPVPSPSALPSPTPTASATPSDQPTATAQAMASCSNVADGYGFSHPVAWQAVHTDGPRACQALHPSALADDDFDGAAIRTERLDVDYDDWVAAYDQPDIVVLEREALTVAGGARATRLLFTFTEDESQRIDSYVIDRGVDVLVFGALSETAPDFDEARRVLATMAATLELFG